MDGGGGVFAIRRTFERLAASAITGFVVSPGPALGTPFPEGVVLRYRYEAGNAVPLPALGEQEFLAMSLGIRPHRARMKRGVVGQVSVLQRTMVPQAGAWRDRWRAQWQVTGGFTVAVEATVSGGGSGQVRNPSSAAASRAPRR